MSGDPSLIRGELKPAGLFLELDGKDSRAVLVALPTTSRWSSSDGADSALSSPGRAA
jgi:hypothetical protein